MLWPQVEGDRARNALHVTLHRLRALLDHPSAVGTKAGRLSLHRATVWVDAFELERLTSTQEGPHPVSDVLALYRGAFLPCDLDAAWSLRLRHRLRMRFVRAVDGAARQFEAARDHAAAVRLYQQGLERDDLEGILQEGFLRNLRAVSG